MNRTGKMVADRLAWAQPLVDGLRGDGDPNIPDWYDQGLAFLAELRDAMHGDRDPRSLDADGVNHWRSYGRKMARVGADMGIPELPARGLPDPDGTQVALLLSEEPPQGHSARASFRRHSPSTDHQGPAASTDSVISTCEHEGVPTTMSSEFENAAHEESFRLIAGFLREAFGEIAQESDYEMPTVSLNMGWPVSIAVPWGVDGKSYVTIYTTLWGPADGPISPAAAHRLLKLNETYRYGGLSLDDEGFVSLMYSLPWEAANKDALRTVVRILAETGSYIAEEVVEAIGAATDRAE